MERTAGGGFGRDPGFVCRRGLILGRLLFNSGCASRAYLEISQKQFCTSISCNRRPKSRGAGPPITVSEHRSWLSVTRYIISACETFSGFLKHFSIPSFAPGPGTINFEGV